VGTPVAVHPAIPCGYCQYCTQGRRHLCASVRYLGSAALLPHTEGGFARSNVVPSQNVRELPADLPVLRFALTEPASGVARRGPSGTRRGASVLVVGAGPIGLTVVAILRLRGARRIVVSDLHALPVQIALRMGADDAVDPFVDGLGGQEEFDVTFECSGTAAGLAAAVGLTGGGVQVVMVGNQRAGDVPFPAARVISKELRLGGSYASTQHSTM